MGKFDFKAEKRKGGDIKKTFTGNYTQYKKNRNRPIYIKLQFHSKLTPYNKT